MSRVLCTGAFLGPAITKVTLVKQVDNMTKGPLELEYPLNTLGVARATGRSSEWVRQNESLFDVIRTPGGQRRYSVESVRRFLDRKATNEP